MSKIKICLDAGHVGSKYNQSPVVKTYYESAMVWKLHLKLKAELETRGFRGHYHPGGHRHRPRRL